MRTLILLAYLFAATVAAHAQEEKTKEDRKFKFDWYLAGGIVANRDFNINQNLRDAGVKEVSKVIPMATLGWAVVFGRYDVGAEFGIGGFWKRDDGYRYNQFPAAVRGNYLILDDEDISIKAGLAFSYISNDLSIYSDDVVIDMDDLNPDNNSGYLRLRNNSWFAGPSMSFALGKWNVTKTKITIGYDFQLGESKWKADYGKVTNPVKEKSDRFFLRVSIPL